MTKNKFKAQDADEPEPPDLERCQTIITNSPLERFMRIGVPPTERCKYKPTWIAVEPPRKDGKTRGMMAICDRCLVECQKQVPNATYLSFPELRKMKRERQKTDLFVSLFERLL